jgi:hypothetical protein
LELYTDGNYPEALKVFTIHKANKVLFFWLVLLSGQNRYVLNDFKDALLSSNGSLVQTKRQHRNFKNSIHDIVYFKLKEYDQVIISKQIEKAPSDEVRLNDSYLRLADYVVCDFKKYGPAMDALH